MYIYIACVVVFIRVYVPQRLRIIPVKLVWRGPNGAAVFANTTIASCANLCNFRTPYVPHVTLETRALRHQHTCTERLTLRNCQPRNGGGRGTGGARTHSFSRALLENNNTELNTITTKVNIYALFATFLTVTRPGQRNSRIIVSNSDHFFPRQLRRNARPPRVSKSPVDRRRFLRLTTSSICLEQQNSHTCYLPNDKR